MALYLLENSEAWNDPSVWPERIARDFPFYKGTDLSRSRYYHILDSLLMLQYQIRIRLEETGYEDTDDLSVAGKLPLLLYHPLGGKDLNVNDEGGYLSDHHDDVYLFVNKIVYNDYDVIRDLVASGWSPIVKKREQRTASEYVFYTYHFSDAQLGANNKYLTEGYENDLYLVRDRDDIVDGTKEIDDIDHYTVESKHRLIFSRVVPEGQLFSYIESLGSTILPREIPLSEEFLSRLQEDGIVEIRK